MSKKVEVVAYCDNWPQLFEEESKLISRALGENCLTVYHIGSTSISGLSAKPVIDMIPVVKDIVLVEKANCEMEKLGYTAKGEFGFPFRRFFQKNAPQINCNVHVFEEGNPEIERHLRFRNWMRTNAEDREAYEQLKTSLAKQFPNDISSYCKGKHEFINEIDRKAGPKVIRLITPFTDEEWSAYHRIRKEQIFDHSTIEYRPDHPKLQFPNAHQFLLLDGQDIVAVAEVQLWTETTAILRPFAVDGKYQRQNYGTKLLELLEKWIKHQGRNCIKVHANLRSHQFYRSRGYVDMEFGEKCVTDDVVDLGKYV